MIQSAASIERQLPANTSIALTYANTHGLHVLGPRIHERDVVAGAREMTADVAADGAGANEYDVLVHVALPL